MRRGSLLLLAMGSLLGAGPATALARTHPFRMPRIRHVFVIVLENESYAKTFGEPAADPYLAQTLRRQGVHAEALRLPTDDVERLGTDGPGGAQQADRAHERSAHPRGIALTTKYVAGMTNSSPSTRSRMPP